MDRIKDIGKSKKFGRTLREQNAKRYGIDNQTLKGLESFYCRTDTDKFTIVELLFRGRRYHGLSAKSDQDISNLTEGIAHAYSRAFDNMATDQDLIYTPYEEYLLKGLNNFQKSMCNCLKNIQTIDMGGLPINDPSVIANSVSGNDIYKIECQHCGETSNYFAKTLDQKTKCPVCDKRLSEPATHTKIAGGSC